MSNWTLVARQAQTEFQQQSIWTSFVERRGYRVFSVAEHRVEIERLNGGQNSILTPGMIENAVVRLRQTGQVRRGNLMNSVAKECALIRFHPNVLWDEQTQSICWRRIIATTRDTIDEAIEEAPEDEFERVVIAVNQRKYQSLFRQNLMAVYQSTCVISNNNCEQVLEAAHISAHATSRNNDTTNGLLLRADLHILFDRGLLQIHPDNLTIHISPVVQQNEYRQYEGKVINNRTDGRLPDINLLQQRWNSVDWAS
jgi:hypothetical protein